MNDPASLLKNLLDADSEAKISIAESLDTDKLRGWMNSSNWKIRNTAVKIVNELGLKSFANIVEFLLTDRTPARFIDRIFGGDYHQVGFIRRNAASALGKIGEPGQAAADALYAGLNDPYWEVRAESIKSCRKIFKTEIPDSLHKAVVNALRDRNFEVTVQAVYTLSECSIDSEIIKYFTPLSDHPNVLVRRTLIEGIKKLRERGIIKSDETVASSLKNIFVPGEYMGIS